AGIQCWPGEADVEAISHVLQGMGSSPDQVAVTLRAASVQGQRDSTSFMNPVVRYLNRSLNIGGRLGVGARGTMLQPPLRGANSARCLYRFRCRCSWTGSTGAFTRTWNRRPDEPDSPVRCVLAD